MKIAVTYDAGTGDVFQHFGRCAGFKIYEVDGKEIKDSSVVGNGGFSHHGLATYLKELGVDTLILGNRGQGAIDALKNAGINEVPGVTGNADKAVESFLKGTLLFNPNAKCDHSHHHHD